MNGALYKVGGPLMANDRCYVVRDADETAATYLRRMEYITLMEPRQQGKTSLINRLIGTFSNRRFTFLARDLMAARSSGHSSRDWYTAVGSRLARQLKFVPESLRPTPPVDCASWEGFLARLAEQAEAANRKIVIVLDEVGAVPQELATDFFSVIRSVYTTRQSFSPWNHLSFVIAGAFSPKDLIKDKTVSNFNVDKRVMLKDFDYVQVKELVSLSDLSMERAGIVAERIYHWTDGHPYVTEYLCSYIANHEPLDTSGPEAAVDEAVQQFLREDTHHLVRISELAAQPELLEYARRITRVPRARFSASLIEKHFHFAYVLGVIKADSDGRCRIRNRLYERALGEGEHPEGSRPTAATVTVVPDGKRRFNVALSFPGEQRDFVLQTAAYLSRQLGQQRVFYDKYYEAELARPNLDTHLQSIYRDESSLIAVFVCADYERKEWCGLEWRALRDLIANRRADSIMLFRFDDTEIPGLFSIDGYISVTGRSPEEIANLIVQRLLLGER